MDGLQLIWLQFDASQRLWEEAFMPAFPKFHLTPTSPPSLPFNHRRFSPGDTWLGNKNTLNLGRNKHKWSTWLGNATLKPALR